MVGRKILGFVGFVVVAFLAFARQGEGFSGENSHAKWTPISVILRNNFVAVEDTMDCADKLKPLLTSPPVNNQIEPELRQFQERIADLKGKWLEYEKTGYTYTHYTGVTGGSPNFFSTALDLEGRVESMMKNFQRASSTLSEAVIGTIGRSQMSTKRLVDEIMALEKIKDYEHYKDADEGFLLPHIIELIKRNASSTTDAKTPNVNYDSGNVKMVMEQLQYLLPLYDKLETTFANATSMALSLGIRSVSSETIAALPEREWSLLRPAYTQLVQIRTELVKCLMQNRTLIQKFQILAIREGEHATSLMNKVMEHHYDLRIRTLHTSFFQLLVDANEEIVSLLDRITASVKIRKLN